MNTFKIKILNILILYIFSSAAILGLPIISNEQIQPYTNHKYWMLLLRSSQKEILYYGIPGKKEESTMIRMFSVKTGIPGERPTPLPYHREYWNIIEATSSAGNPETSPFFLTLDIPYTENSPYGPEPYLECNGQCNWILPGAFGLHGVASDSSKLSKENPGSSGCIRHEDADITYLYNLLQSELPVRYYIVDS